MADQFLQSYWLQFDAQVSSPRLEKENWHKLHELKDETENTSMTGIHENKLMKCIE